MLAVQCLVLSQSTCVTDGQTDGQNYDSQDRASITVSRGENEEEILVGETHCPDSIRMHSLLCFGLYAGHS